MQTFYLVGQISPKYAETYEWRKKVIDEMQYSTDIDFINPCANPFNQKVLEEKEYAVRPDGRASGIDVLPSKDLTFCMRSNGAIVNMNQYDPDKPLLGSFFELAWYYMMPEKTVIAFADDLNSYLCQHPFVQKAVTTWVNNEDEATYVLKKYFSTVKG